MKKVLSLSILVDIQKLPLALRIATAYWMKKKIWQIRAKSCSGEWGHESYVHKTILTTKNGRNGRYSNGMAFICWENEPINWSF